MVPCQPGLRVLARALAGEHGADGKARSQSFGEGHYIGANAAGLMGEERASAPHAGLDFVEDEQGAVGVAGGARGLQEFGAGDADAAFTLHWLDDASASLPVDGLCQGVAVVEIYLGKFSGQGREGLVVLAAGADGEQRAPVKAAATGDYFVLIFMTLVVGVFPR